MRKIDPLLVHAKRGDNLFPMRIFLEQIAGYVLGIALISVGVIQGGLLGGLTTFFGVIFVGATNARGLEVGHAALHGRFFVGKLKSLNTPIGVISCLPTAQNWIRWLVNHCGLHHRDVRREAFSYDLGALTTFSGVIKHLLMIQHVQAVVKELFGILSRRWKTGIEIRVDNAIVRLEFLNAIAIYTSLALVLFATVVATVTVRASFPLILLGIYAITAITHTLIELPEHHGTDVNEENFLFNSREIRTSRLGRWFTLRNCYHASHHVHPSIPVHKLDLVHPEIFLRAKYTATSYPAFYYQFFGSLFLKRPIASLGAPLRIEHANDNWPIAANDNDSTRTAQMKRGSEISET